MNAAEVRLKQGMVDALAGNARAYTLLLDEVGRLLRTYYARRLGQAHADVEDLVQDTLIAIHRRRASYDVTLAFTPWLYAVARYKLIDHYRRSGVRKHVPIDDVFDLVSPDEIEPAMARRDLDGLLDQLPDHRADLIRQTRIEGLSMAEAAAAVGSTEGAVKLQVHRGLKALAARVRGLKPDEAQDIGSDTGGDAP